MAVSPHQGQGTLLWFMEWCQEIPCQCSFRSQLCWPARHWLQFDQCWKWNNFNNTRLIDKLHKCYIPPYWYTHYKDSSGRCPVESDLRDWHTQWRHQVTHHRFSSLCTCVLIIVCKCFSVHPHMMSHPIRGREHSNTPIYRNYRSLQCRDTLFSVTFSDIQKT